MAQTAQTDSYVLSLDDIDLTQVALVGGKGARLGELARIDGIRVPAGLCVTTDAFRRFMAAAPQIEIAGDLDRLTLLNVDERDAIRAVSAEVRHVLEATPIPDDVASAIAGALPQLSAHVGGDSGNPSAYAVRSSATAEDLPTASFAGQQDSYLNVIGPSAVLDHVRRCWASLFTERAVSYRLRNGFDHRQVHMAVVVQQMVAPSAAGVMFTADPVTSNRTVVSVEATLGLGEALVSGLVNADVFTVCDDAIVTRAVATKDVAIEPLPAGGTKQRAIEPARRHQPALTDAQVVHLARLGRQIEAHFGCPQDIEWCLASDGFHIVQSRPITTLFPIPVRGDSDRHVYLSVGHQQMMTDAMKPLGLSFFQLSARPPMHAAGGRLFVDVTVALGSPEGSAGLVDGFGKADPLTGDALRTIVERGFIPIVTDDTISANGTTTAPPVAPTAAPPPTPIETDPDIVTDLIAQSRASIATLRHNIETLSGEALLDFIRDDIQELKRILFDPRSHQVFMAAIEASWWLNDQMLTWLGEHNAADTLTQAVPNNVTSDMGLALLDVADVIRPHPEVVAFLHTTTDDSFLDGLPALPGGPEAHTAIRDYLDMYGMRCIGEIDITRPRWSERPTALLPALLSNITNFEPGARERRVEQGRREAADKEQELLTRVRALPDGQQKADDTKRMIDRVRTFIGYREYPKYGMISRYFVYKQALLKEAARLVHEGVLRAADDIWFLSLAELHDVVRTRHVDADLIRRREADFASFQLLTPPRVLTSDGEVIVGAYRRDDDLPTGALIGLPVSSGTIEGRARVVLDMTEAAALEPGDILVTAYTDPSWSPVFVAVSGLVTEVGGQMTHGAVIAREYGLPAVVGVEHATRLIRDGQRIRVDGTHGSIEFLA